MQIPPYVKKTLDQLEQHGHEAYVVGGCVRDSVLGVLPHDWDICTAATPEEMLQVFCNQTVIPTGLSHGTVTLLCDDIPLEITTYRVEGEYRDHRRPDTVRFVTSVERDLSRRDFTVNAMAFHPVRGLVDPFGGVQDAQARCLRCVGDPYRRFEEDALRILRALRFASVYGFTIEAETKAALLSTSSLLKTVAAERVESELKRMLTGDRVGDVLRTTYPVLFAVIPELAATEGVDQRSRYHHLDVLSHILTTVECAEPDLTVRVAALLHDIGKPECFSMDENGSGHFYGHADISEKKARTILTRLRFEGKTIDEVCTLIRYHDLPVERDDRAVRRWMNRLGVKTLRRLLALKKADTMAHAPHLMEARFEELRDLAERVDRLEAENACFSLRHLAIDGEDVLALGLPAGKAVGESLRWALDEVIEQRLPNEREILLHAIGKRLDYFLKKR